MTQLQKALRLLLFIELLTIVYFSLKSPGGGVNITLNDKVGHFIGYGVLSLNTFLVFRTQTRWQTFLFIAGLIGIGVLMEYFQGFVPGREVSGFDVIANSLGVACGALGYFLWGRVQSSLKRS